MQARGPILTPLPMIGAELRSLRRARPIVAALSMHTSSPSTRARGRLYWSKIQEPEAVPLLNFTDVGDRNRDILALVPLDRALIVFKEDGIYSVTGSAPSSWIVDEIDTTLRFIDQRLRSPHGGFIEGLPPAMP